MSSEKILIVEDNPTNLKLARLLLLAEGYEVHTAVDAVEAFKVLELILPDLILMDIQLPDKNGLDLTREIKSNPKFKDICIVALTAYAMKGDEEKAKNAGCDGYMTKPISATNFPAEIASYLKKPAVVTDKSEFPDEPRILIIEDNPVSRKLLKVYLESENYTVVEAEDGTSAMAEAQKKPFDLIIQDIFLPDMDGFELNKKLRLLPGNDKIPIFAISGFLTESDIKEKMSGFTTFILKPIEPSYLLDVIRAHLPISTPSQTLVGKGWHVLIADDNPIQLKLFSMQLRNVGFDVTSALDGVIALEKAKQRRPDAIISDILMPNLDGFGLCSEIKRDPNLCAIPVVLLTSHYLEEEDLVLAKNVGASCYLTRTPDVEKFLVELVKVLNAKSPVILERPFELTDEIKEKHAIRAIRQLEQQVLDNAKLAQRCAMLMSQLSLIGGVANALTVSNKDSDEFMKEVLYYCLDATGISKGALYLKKENNEVKLSQQIGYDSDEYEKVESFFGASDLISNMIEKNKPFSVPSKNFSGKRAQDFLAEANVKTAFIDPMYLGEECLGILFLGSNQINLSSENTIEFVRTLGMQVGQSIALTSAFNKLASSETRYRQLVEISPDAIFIYQNGKFSYANPAALKLLNANSMVELLSHPFYDFFPSDFQQVISEYTHKEGNRESLSIQDGRIINLKNEIRDVEIVLSPFLYQENPAVYMIMRDITDRKRSAMHLEIQYEIAWILAEAATLFVATAKVLKIICERLHWDCGTIWAVDKNDNVLRCTRVWHMPEIQNDSFKQQSQSLNCSPGVGLPGKVWKEGKAIWKSNILHDEHMLRKTAIAEVGFNTAVAFPIIYENEVLGVIEFFTRTILSPDYESLLWFESVGNQFGLFLMRKHMEKQMLYLAEHDVLTGLSNRSLLERYLATALINAEENNLKLAILFLDIDHFKYVNDSMGHEAGDLLLKEIAERFRKCLRPQDTISRMGGDEFIIIIPNVGQHERIIEIINRLQHQLSNQITLKEREFVITASIGISVYPENGTTVQKLIKGADIAMYAAKENGRNNFQFCTSEMTAKAENRGILQNNLTLALENKEFILYYQPKIDIATKKIIGVEALIRWQSSDSILMPGSFMAAVESSDLIVPIGEWVLRTACLQNKLWQRAGLPDITMSINLSIRNLNMELLQVMEEALQETKLDPRLFEIELTESALMENVENNIQILRSLKEMGVKISIDDFGTGYSSLSYLKRFPIDTLKIDQSFVRDIATDPDDAAIVTAIIAMAHSLNFRVIAEGVETEAQLKFLCEHGCDEIQGYYFSQPLPVDEATSYIKNAKPDWNFL